MPLRVRGSVRTVDLRKSAAPALEHARARAATSDVLQLVDGSLFPPRGSVAQSAAASAGLTSLEHDQPSLSSLARPSFERSDCARCLLESAENRLVRGRRPCSSAHARNPPFSSTTPRFSSAESKGLVAASTLPSCSLEETSASRDGRVSEELGRQSARAERVSRDRGGEREGERMRGTYRRSTRPAPLLRRARREDGCDLT